MQKRKYIKRYGKHIKVKRVDGRYKVKEAVYASGSDSTLALYMLEDGTIAFTVENHKRNTKASVRLTLESFALLFEAMKAIDKIMPCDSLADMSILSVKPCPQN